MVSVNGNGNNFFKANEYGIDKKELKSLKKETANVDFNGDGKVDHKDTKELKEAIKNGDLGAYLDRVGNDIQGVMGLHLTGKVDGTEAMAKAKTIAELEAIVDEMQLDPNTDKAKVVSYIKMANIARIEKEQQNYADLMTRLQDTATASRMEDFFATPEMQTLNNLFGIA